MIRTLVLRLTHGLWNREISRILCRAREECVITDEQMHDLAAAFDPTQRHIVYGPRVPHGFYAADGVVPVQDADSEIEEWAKRMLRDAVNSGAIPQQREGKK